MAVEVDGALAGDVTAKDLALSIVATLGTVAAPGTSSSSAGRRRARSRCRAA